jgi:hypothetical protein
MNSNWGAVRISALEHPNVLQQREVVPGAVTQEFIDLMAQEYGVGSGVYQSRVMGEFPDDSGPHDHPPRPERLLLRRRRARL